MFKYTRAAISSVIHEFKIWSIIFTWGLFAVTVGYNIFAILMDIGYLWANITSLCIITLSTIFDLVTKSKDIKTVKRVVKRLVSWLKIVLKGAVLGLTIYGLYVASTDFFNQNSASGTFCANCGNRAACYAVRDKKTVNFAT